MAKQDFEKYIIPSDLIATIRKELKELPSTEFTYYTMVLIASIKKEKDIQKYISILRSTYDLTQKLKAFYKSKPEHFEENILAVNDAVSHLVKLSRINSIPNKIKNIVLAISGVVLATFIGIVFGGIGLCYGLLTNVNIVGNVRGAGLGLFAGAALGAFVGYRMPLKFLQKSINTKLEFCLRNISRLREELADRRSHDEYSQETKKYILDTFFKDVPAAEREAKFNEFLKTDQSFQVCTTTAGHIHNRLKGYLGHHALIRFKINGIKDIPIEFGDRTKTPGHVDQSEPPRIVKGQVLFDMLVLDRILQETHKNTFEQAKRIYTVGDDDCRTYVDKILVGTGQTPTPLSRFDETLDTLIGRKVVAPLTFFSSQINEKELHNLASDDDEKIEVNHHKFQGKKDW